MCNFGATALVLIVDSNSNSSCSSDSSDCISYVNDNTTSTKFLVCDRDMKKGTELSIKYASDAKTLLKWGIK